MSRPALLLLDEPTAGLAPLIVKQFAEILVGLNRSGQTILLVEQNIRMALAIAHHVYVIRNGEIVLESDAKDVANDEALFRSYLG
jgi:branched-chain amino acid transport system ATP-binding protein